MPGPDNTRPPATCVAGLLFLASGAAGLGYQVVWTRQAAAGLGHEQAALMAVVSAFLAGLAVGAWCLDGRVSRSARPGRWYAGLEIILGLWAAGTAWWFPALSARLAAGLGTNTSALIQGGLAFGGLFVALLPATAAMGATLAAMDRWVARRRADLRSVGWLYALNTLGAVAGVVAVTWLLLPRFGLRGTLLSLSLMNLVCGVVAWRLLGRPLSAEPAAAGDGSGGAGGIRLWLTLAIAGGLGMGFELVGVRVLSQVLPGTIHSFAVVLAVYLVGTALGAAAFQRWGRFHAAETLATPLLGGLMLSVLVGLVALGHSPRLYAGCLEAWGRSTEALRAAEVVVALAVFLGPVALMGALFALLAQHARRGGGGVGRAFAWNTAGGAVGAPWLLAAALPAWGAQATLILVAVGYGLLAAGWGRPRWLFGCGLGVLALWPMLPGHLVLVDLPPGGRVIAARAGMLGTVTVVEAAEGSRVLRVDNHFQMGGTAAIEPLARHAHLPLLLHPAPKRALFLGLGTGITLGAASLYPDVEAVGVELVPEVVDVLSWFSPSNRDPQRQPRQRVVVADARRFLISDRDRYDVVVADLFHPARDGAALLYTREHFRRLRAVLAPGGLCCQWLPLYQMDDDILAMITRTFLEVFPEAQLWLLRFNVDTPVVGLVGGLDPLSLGLPGFEARLGHQPLAEELRRFSLGDRLRVHGHFLAGSDALRAFAQGAPLNTDDRPRVLFGGPASAASAARSVLHRLDRWLVEGVSSGRDGREESAGLAAYCRARNSYLRGLVTDAEGRADVALDAWVESARLSVDFTAGYAQCLSRAAVQHRSNPEAARRLLERLIAARPERPVAGELLRRLGP